MTAIAQLQIAHVAKITQKKDLTFFMVMDFTSIQPNQILEIMIPIKTFAAINGMCGIQLLELMENGHGIKLKLISTLTLMELFISSIMEVILTSFILMEMATAFAMMQMNSIISLLPKNKVTIVLMQTPGLEEMVQAMHTGTTKVFNQWSM
jgi:hypothetical protein